MAGVGTNRYYAEVRTTGNDINGGIFAGACPLATPSAPTVSNAGSGGSVAANTYYVVITISDCYGETPMSGQSSTTTTGASSTITVNHPTNPNSQGASWNVYIGTTNNGPYFLQNSSTDFTTNYLRTTTPATTGNQPPGIDYSQQDAFQISYTDLVIDGSDSTRVTSAAHPFNATHVGNSINVSGGTGFSVRTNPIKAVDASGAAFGQGPFGTLGSTGGVGKLGGAWATLGFAAGPGSGVSDVTAFTKAGTYTMTSTQNVSGGKVVAVGSMCIVGYNTTRTVTNVDATRPLINASNNTMTMISLGNGNFVAFLRQVDLNGNGHTAVNGVVMAGAGNVIDHCSCTAMANGFNLTGTSNGGVQCYNSVADGTTANGFLVNVNCYVENCTAKDLAQGVGFSIDSQGYVSYSVAIGTGNGVSTAVGFSLTSSSTTNDTATGLATGFSIGSNAGGAPSHVTNCLAWDNTTNFTGSLAGGNTLPLIENSAGGGATTNIGGTICASQLLGGFVTLTANPFQNPGGGDYSLNNVAGGGAAAGAAGAPVTIPGTNTPSTPNIGAAQAGTTSISGGLVGNNMRGWFAN